MKTTIIRQEINLIKTVRQTLRFTMIGYLLLVLSGCGMLDDLAKEGIESAGSDLTGVEVEVADTDLWILGGMGEISGLTVPNPPGYTADYALELDLLRVNIGIFSTLVGDAILLEELVIDAPKVNFEQTETGSSNLKTLADHGRVKSDEETEESSGEPVRLIIEKLILRDPQYSILLASGQQRSGTLPTIELSDVGDPGGKTPAGLGMVVLLSMGREMFLELAAEKLQSRVADFGLDLQLLDIEHIMQTVEQKIALSREQLEQIRPVLQEKSQALRLAVEEVKKRGLLNLESLPTKFEVIAAQTREELSDHLSPDQLDQIETLFQQLQQTTREEIVDALSTRLAHFLELHQEQIEDARSILGNEIEQRSKLLARLIHDPLLPPSEFMGELKMIQKKTRSRLEPLLDRSKMEHLAELQEQLRTLIEEAYFGIAAPLIEELRTSK